MEPGLLGAVDLDFQHGARDTSSIEAAQDIGIQIAGPGKSDAIIEDARQRTRRRRVVLLLAALVVAAIGIAGYYLFDGSGPGVSTQSQSHAASQERNCFGLSGVAGEGDGSARTVISSSSCGFVSAEALKSDITSKADWYAAFSPRLTVGALKLGCGLSYPDARMYVQKLGPTFSVETLRNFRAACKG